MRSRVRLSHLKPPRKRFKQCLNELGVPLEEGKAFAGRGKGEMRVLLNRAAVKKNPRSNVNNFNPLLPFSEADTIQEKNSL